jgi:DNA-binding transcriptional LysR family regulator
MVRDELSVLAAFLSVAEERSFTKAAKKLNVSTSGLSHAIRRLEEQIGVRLLARSTRSVLPTPAGEELIAHLRPALSDVQETLTRLAGQQDRPVGRVRLAVPRLAAMSVLGDKLGEFVRKYPDVVLDITTDAGDRLDIVAGGFDAGIHFGDYIAQDMVAVRVSPDQRHAIVGSPEYFKSFPIPKSPRDLLNQRCISFRHGADEIYRWELEKDEESVNVGVSGSLILDDEDLSVRAALDGAGLAMVSEEKVAVHISSGALKRVMKDWCQPFPGFFLYYPSRRHQPAALAALIETLRLEGKAARASRAKPSV